MPLEVTDITTHTKPTPSPPCSLSVYLKHMHIQLSWGTCQSSDSAWQGFYGGPLEGWGEGGGGGGGQTAGHMHSTLTVIQL